MLDGQLVFSQLMNFLPRRECNACADKYRGNRRSCGFSCRDQFLRLGFAQITYRESLRDVETCLRALGRKLHAQESLAVDLAQTVYALDSTTIDLCLSLFPWAKFRRRKSALKLLPTSTPWVGQISP